ncbi:unnamed protein product [Rodentolepis nana]|uniref:C2 tensin-type domain-containing protein n=1 Tax=Rodentolepis nana TaxID=102285 RepID=A0A0R3TRG6_RODNA|nr:unnamed protein product [Rodentolepis nana]
MPLKCKSSDRFSLFQPCRVDYELKVFVVDEDGSRAQKRCDLMYYQEIFFCNENLNAAQKLQGRGGGGGGIPCNGKLNCLFSLLLQQLRPDDRPKVDLRSRRGRTPANCRGGS